VAEIVGRLFVAVALPDDLRHALAAHLDAELGGRTMPGRPVVPDNWHLTLRFLGKMDALGYDRVLAALDTADLGPAFAMGFTSLGAFPRPHRATVLWLGVGEGEGELRRLAAVVEAAVDDAGLMPEERPFHPHLTLSRIRPHQDVTATMERVSLFPGRIRVGDIALFRSHLRSGPPRYEVMERFPLSPT
jgi:2'-5' RNA ligase